MPAPLLRAAPLAAIALCSTAWASSVIAVAPGEDVQNAIDLAYSGDTVVLQAGTHEACIRINKPIILLGMGSSSTTLDCGGERPDTITVVGFGGTDPYSFVRIGGLTVHNGGSGRGLRATGGATVILGYAEFSDLFSDVDGGAVLVEPENLVAAVNVAFVNNYSRSNGGAIAATGGASFQTLGSTFERNRANGDGGAVFAANASVNLSSDTFADNEATRGGAIYLHATTSTESTESEVHRCRFDDNLATEAGGALLAVYQTVRIADSWFSRNHSTVNGAVVLQNSTAPTIERSLFCQNSADGEGSVGGGLALFDSTYANVRETLWIGNQAGKAGSAVYEQVDSRYTSQWNNNTFLVNQLLGADVQAGAHAFSGGSAYITDSLYWGNENPESGARTALSNSSPTPIGYYGSNFFLQTVYGVVDYRDDKTRANTIIDPVLVGWSDDDTCYNDRPTYTSEDLISWGGGRVGIEAGGQVTTDWDGDGQSAIEGDRDDVLTNFGDLDGDGESAETDCDDTNPAIRPYVPDVPYDGIDADCDGFSDYDADQDGVNAGTHGGLDCDDFNPDVKPNADDTPYDGIDADCDGFSDFDADRDGDDAEAHGGLDCDDFDPLVFFGSNDCHYDDDNDGIDSLTEGTDDKDEDGTPNYFDPDDDGDGIDSLTEGTDDADRDGAPNYLDDDDDGDGIDSLTEGTDDADRDGAPNYLDDDSDGDGALDESEGETADADGDGVPNYLDNGDSDGNIVAANKPAFPEVGCDASGGTGLGATGWLTLGALTLVRRRRPAA